MRISVFAYSKKGCETARRILGEFQNEETASWCPGRLLETKEDPFCAGLSADFQPIPKLFRPFYGERFAASDALIFVGACGIAVREIAPFVKSKKTDPAVLCVDDHARFVIPVLSGHIGGANELAADLAEKLGAVPVITTATDINGKFSVDTWAARNGFVIDNMKAAKDVSALILDQDIPIYSELPVRGEYPNGTFEWKPVAAGKTGVDGKGLHNEKTSPEKPAVGIYIGWEKKNPFEETLRLIPKVLTLGIGCRKGTEKETIQTVVKQILENNKIDYRAIRQAASIDLKEEEEGLLEFCAEAGIKIRFYTAEELKAVKGDFSSSEFVKSVTGVDNVCERAAMADAKELVLPKTAENGVTVAAAVQDKTISF